MPRLTTLALVVLPVAMALALAGTSARAEDPPATAAPAPASPIDLQNAKCPVSGKPVAPGITDTVNGEVVHFCGAGCVAKYRANPSAYVSALRSEPAVAKRMDEAHAKGAPMAMPAAPMVMPAARVLSDSKGAAFHDAMRKLWEDHVLWTRLFVVSAVAGLPDQEATTNRLLRNQDDIGNGIKPYYGAEAAAKLTALLKDHILTAADLVGALKAKDAAKADAAKTKWSANADDIAAFLSGANPKAWPLEAAKSMMHEHLSATTDEVAARLKGDWAADIAAYDKVREQALQMADMLSDGIRRQFPEKFK